MTTELMYLVLVALLTGSLWIPVVIGYVRTRGPLTPEVDESIVNSSAVRDTATNDHRRFRCDSRASEFRQRLPGIPNRVEGTTVRVSRHVLVDGPRIVGWARIHEAEYDALGREGIGDAAQFRRIPVRNGTVGAGKQKDDRGCARGRLHRIYRRTRERLNEDGEQRQEEHRTMVHKKGLGTGD